MKALTYLGYVPEKLDRMPGEVRSFIAGRSGLLWDQFVAVQTASCSDRATKIDAKWPIDLMASDTLLVS